MGPRIVVSVFAFALFIVALLWEGSQQILLEHVAAVPHERETHVFMTIHNTGEPDRLLAVSSNQAQASFFRPDAENKPLPIPALHTSELSADGSHLVLREIKGKIDEGRLIPLTLTFDRAGAIATKARIETAPMKHGGFGDASISKVEEGTASPSLHIEVVPADNGWKVEIQTQNFEFSEALIDGAHVPGTGHAHLFVDGVKIGRVYSAEAHIPPLPPGRHVVRVTLNTNDHRVYQAGGELITDTAEITAN